MRELMDALKKEIAEYREAKSRTSGKTWNNESIKRYLQDENRVELAMFGDRSPTKKDEANTAFCVMAKNSDWCEVAEKLLCALETALKKSAEQQKKAENTKTPAES